MRSGTGQPASNSATSLLVTEERPFGGSSMRLFFAVLTMLVATVTMPAAARAACPGFVASEALRDRAVDAKVHSRKFKGAAAQSAIANLKKGIASAETCATSGSANDRAATLAVIAQLRWNQACVLTYDGVASDGAAAIAIAKASDRDMDAFMASRGSLSEDARVLFENWEHFDGDIESRQPGSCLE